MKKHNIKLAISLIFLLGVICYAVAIIVIGNNGQDNISQVSSDKFQIFDTNNIYNEDTTDSEEWHLLLVNYKNRIPDNYDFELEQLDNGRLIDKRIYPDLQEMFNDMRNAGIYPVVSEGYRTDAEQEQMMTDKINAYIYEGYSRNDAEKFAGQTVASVGCSEHQIGLAVDINADEIYSSNEEVYVWLAENAYKYGFILRYPSDKTDITMIDYEPWHYRYVGKAAAEEIFFKKICLEEYVNLGSRNT